MLATDFMPLIEVVAYNEMSSLSSYIRKVLSLSEVSLKINNYKICSCANFCSCFRCLYTNTLAVNKHKI